MAIETDQIISTPSVLLLGSSSQIGIFAIPQLILAGFRVLAVNRKGKPEGYPDFGQVEWVNETDGLSAAEGCEHLLSTGPLDLARKFLTRADVTPDLTQGLFKSVVIFSSSSVATKQKSANHAEKSQVKNMLDLETDLQSIAQDSGIKMVILRPTLIYGCGMDSNISRLAAWIRDRGYMPVNGQASGMRQPVHAEDLASVAINAMLSEKPLPSVMYLCGGETLSYSDMVEKIFPAMGMPVKLVRLPEWLFVLLVRLGGSTKIAEGINAEMVRRQRIDLEFDDQRARQLLFYNPRSFAPSEADFSMPKF